MNDNSGFIIGGNARIEAGVVVGGQNAQAHVVQNRMERPDDELGQRLEELLVILRQAVQAGRVDAELLGTAEAVEQELGQQKPNKHSILGLLSGIASGAGSIEIITKAVDAVKTLVTQVL